MEILNNVDSNLIHQFPGNIYCKDLNGIIFWHNNNASEYLKNTIGIDNLIGKTVYDLFDAKSAEKCHEDDIKIFNSCSNNIQIKQEELLLINFKVQHYLTITKPIINNTGNINGIMVNTINIDDMQQKLKFHHLDPKLHTIKNSLYMLKEMLIIINIMETTKIQQDLQELLIELKSFVKKLLIDYRK